MCYILYPLWLSWFDYQNNIWYKEFLAMHFLLLLLLLLLLLSTIRLFQLQDKVQNWSFFYMLYLFLYFCHMHSALTIQQSAFIQSFQMAKPNTYKIINKITTLGILSKFFFHQLMYKWIVLKTILRFTLKSTLKQLRHVSVQSHHHQGAHYSSLLKLQLLK